MEAGYTRYEIRLREPGRRLVAWVEYPQGDSEAEREAYSWLVWNANQYPGRRFDFFVADEPIEPTDCGPFWPSA